MYRNDLTAEDWEPGVPLYHSPVELTNMGLYRNVYRQPMFKLKEDDGDAHQMAEEYGHPFPCGVCGKDVNGW